MEAQKKFKLNDIGQLLLAMNQKFNLLNENVGQLKDQVNALDHQIQEDVMVKLSILEKSSTVVAAEDQAADEMEVAAEHQAAEELKAELEEEPPKEKSAETVCNFLVGDWMVAQANSIVLEELPLAAMQNGTVARSLVPKEGMELQEDGKVPAASESLNSNGAKLGKDSEVQDTVKKKKIWKFPECVTDPEFLADQRAQIKGKMGLDSTNHKHLEMGSKMAAAAGSTPDFSCSATVGSSHKAPHGFVAEICPAEDGRQKEHPPKGKSKGSDKTFRWLRCYKCKEPGHLAKNCPKMAAHVGVAEIQHGKAIEWWPDEYDLAHSVQQKADQLVKNKQVDMDDPITEGLQLAHEPAAVVAQDDYGIPASLQPRPVEKVLQQAVLAIADEPAAKFCSCDAAETTFMVAVADNHHDDATAEENVGEPTSSDYIHCCPLQVINEAFEDKFICPDSVVVTVLVNSDELRGVLKAPKAYDSAATLQSDGEAVKIGDLTGSLAATTCFCAVPAGPFDPGGVPPAETEVQHELSTSPFIKNFNRKAEGTAGYKVHDRGYRVYDPGRPSTAADV